MQNRITANLYAPLLKTKFYMQENILGFLHHLA